MVSPFDETAARVKADMESAVVAAKTRLDELAQELSDAFGETRHGVYTKAKEHVEAAWRLLGYAHNALN